jgi:hypothetical protein
MRLRAGRPRSGGRTTNDRGGLREAFGVPAAALLLPLLYSHKRCASLLAGSKKGHPFRWPNVVD